MPSEAPNGRSVGQVKVLALIQARMASTRLPGKVLADIGGKPLVFHIVERLRQARRIDEVAIATTTEPSDDSLVAAAEDAGVPVHRGAVDDIVERLRGAARRFEADVVVRIWGDCPLIDSGVVDRLVELLLSRNLDFATNALPENRTYPPGLDAEVYSRHSLDRLDAEASDPRDREFPVEYLRARPDEFSMDVLHYTEDLSALHLTVDYIEDLENVRRIYGVLERRKLPSDLATLVGLLRAEPELVEGFSKSPRNIEYRAYLDSLSGS